LSFSVDFLFSGSARISCYLLEQWLAVRNTIFLDFSQSFYS